MTDLRTIHEKFLELERDFQLWDRTISGFPFWDYLRVPVYNSIKKETGFFSSNDWHTRAPVPKPETPLQKLAFRWQKLHYWLFNNPFRQKKYDYLFIGHPRRKLGEDNTYWDLYCDPIIDHLGRDKCLLIEEPYMGLPKHARPAHTKNLAYTEAFYLYQRFNKLKPTPEPRLGNDDEELLHRLEENINEIFKINMPIDFIKIFNYAYCTHHDKLQILTPLLDRLKPKILFIVCSYGKESWIKASKEINIPTVELQHGVMGKYHPGYSYPSPSKKHLFPDCFLSFGEYWNESVYLPIEKEKISTIGYPYFNKQKKEYDHVQKKNQILFISQGTIGHDLSHWALALQKELPIDWQIIYKLHPGETINWQTRYPHLAECNEIEVVENDTPPLYQLMAESTIQVGVYSTALYEGLGFDCRTYIAKLNGWEYLDPLIKRGHADLASKPLDIRIESNPQKRSFDNTVFFGDDDWNDKINEFLHKNGFA